MRNERQNKRNNVTAPLPFSGNVILSVVEGGGWEGVVGASSAAQSTPYTCNEGIKLVTSTAQAAQAPPTSAKSYGGQPIARTLRQACAERSRSAQDDTQASALSALCVFPLRSLRLKQLLLLITILLITNNPSHAQTPYTGGAGDGHAMGELQLRSVAVNELSTTNGYQIYPELAKAGEAIYITSPVGGEMQIIDITGRIIHTQTIEQPVQQLPVVVTQTGLCIGIIRTQMGTFTQKIIVVE